MGRNGLTTGMRVIALKTILIIEDDRAINNLIKGTLSAEGYV